MPRDEAYRIVQRAAADASDRGSDLRTALETDDEVSRTLSAHALDELFDPRRFLRNLGGGFERLEKLPAEEVT